METTHELESQKAETEDDAEKRRGSPQMLVPARKYMSTSITIDISINLQRNRRLVKIVNVPQQVNDIK